MYGQDILCGISKVPFEIPHKISYPHIERCVFLSAMKMWELLDLRVHKCFWNGPQDAHDKDDKDTFFALLVLCEGNLPVTGQVEYLFNSLFRLKTKETFLVP